MMMKPAMAVGLCRKRYHTSPAKVRFLLQIFSRSWLDCSSGAHFSWVVIDALPPQLSYLMRGSIRQ